MLLTRDLFLYGNLKKKKKTSFHDPELSRLGGIEVLRLKVGPVRRNLFHDLLWRFTVNMIFVASPLVFLERFRLI